MAEATAPASPPLTRREFLMYVWAASIALASAGGTGAILWFAYPIFREGEFGGKFSVPISKLPQKGTDPDPHADGRFWLVNLDAGVQVLYMVCVHLGCLYKWVPSNNRFECPCHGSKYQKDGTYIEGPAPRSLDRFRFQFVDENGNELAQSDPGKDQNGDPNAGQPVTPPDGAVNLVINTGDKVKGKNHA